MFIRKLHCDERGSISIVSVFAVMFLTMLLGMVMNVGRHVDGKIRMQNAADSAAYSGGVVLARGMNTLAFTNNLLCDVF
ncbi:MAG: flp pilus-assembly TadE/G-like family protein, partial [Thermoguttaceae bacterium]